MSRDLFEDLFVLELANNHWGRVDRGLRIIEDHARIVRFNNVRAGIKTADQRCRNICPQGFPRSSRYPLCQENSSYTDFGKRLGRTCQSYPGKWLYTDGHPF